MCSSLQPKYIIIIYEVILKNSYINLISVPELVYTNALISIALTNNRKHLPLKCHILALKTLASSTSSNLNFSTANASGILPPNPTPRRILLVEDNHLNRQMLEDYLVFCGYQVLSLGSGSGYFQALRDFQPHLILLDLKLPDIDGYTLLEQMRQKSEWQVIPVIVVSAFAFKADRQRALNLGAKRYFIKPVSLRDLKQAIEDELLKL